jgi:hypothetical protein
LLFTFDDYQTFHKKLQQELGDDILGQTLLDRPEQRLVFVGLRSLANAKAIQAAGGLIVAFDCPIEIRFARVDHSGLKYHKTFNDFQKAEEDVVYSPDGYSTEIKQIMEVADVAIDTSRAVEFMYQDIDALMAQLSEKPEAPATK